MIPLTITGILLLLAAPLVYFNNRRTRGEKTEARLPIPVNKADCANHSRAVGDFYDEHTDAFLSVYGDVIQAFRTTDISKLLSAQACTMNLKQDMKVLDAGCGICGPAIYFAKNYGVRVDAVTASGKQAAIAKDKINNEGLNDRVSVLRGDYHELDAILGKDSYDVVYFLESFGHSADKPRAIDAAWKVLKPGGLLYIKDLFVKEAARPGDAGKIKENVQRINEAYRYQVGDLYKVIHALRSQGFILSSLKTIDLPLEDFENLTVSNTFQDLTGINRIDSLDDYLFPVDFFELSCIKPWYDLSKGNSRYFLQNLYHMQVLHRPAHEL